MAGIGGLLYGADVSVIATALPYIENSTNYTTQQIGLIVGMVLWGTVISSFFAGQLAEWFGRKKIIIVAAFVFALSIPISCSSGFFAGGNFYLIAFGRLLQGIAGGLIGVVVPLYLAECLPTKKRGFGTAMFQLIITFGLVLASLVGLIVTSCVGPAYSAEAGSTIDFSTIRLWTMSWQFILALNFIPAIVLFVGAFFLKESPRWLYKKGKEDLALKSIYATNDKIQAKIMFDEICGSALKTRTNSGNKSKNSLLKKKYVWPFLLICVVLILNQATGINSILNYSVNIFREAGLQGEAANWSDLIIKFINLSVTTFAVLLVDKKGRKFLLKVGTFAIVLGEIGLATMFGVMNAGIVAVSTFSGIMTSLFFYIVIAGYAFGPGVCVWLVLTELMPSRIRANGMAIAMILNQGVVAFIASIFPSWSEAAGMFGVFAVLAIFSLIYFLVATFILPETKGKSLEEIEKNFE